MDNAQKEVSIPDMLASIATGGMSEFTLYFTRLRKMFPDEVAEACLWYISSRELNPIGRSMACWLSSQGRYAHVLFESEALPLVEAGKALAILKQIDDKFLIGFLKATDRISSPRAILRALALIPNLGDYSLLIPWLRRLASHTDERVKSKSLKLFCQLRPNGTLIERQMQAKEPRLRANAIEALWHSRTPEAAGIFKSATFDRNHRVVGNAYIGLYLQKDQAALPKMIELSENPDPLVRAAMAWSFGFIRDERAIPALEVLSKDTSPMVRKRALQSLLALQPE